MENIKKKPKKNLIKDTGKTLKLIFKANPLYFVIVCAATLLQGVIPIMQLSVGKYLLDGIILAVRQHGSEGSIRTIIFWLIAEFLLFFTSTIVDSIKRFIQLILGNYLVLSINKQLFRKAASLDAAFFENPEFYNQLMKARQGVGQRPMQTLENLFAIIQNMITILGLAGLIIFFNPIILIILIITTIPTLYIELFFSRKVFKLFEERVQQERKKEYYGWLSTDKWAFKEIRLFNLGEFLISKYDEVAIKHLEQDNKINIKRSIAYNLVNTLLLVIYYGIYGYIILCTISETISIGSMSMYVNTVKQLQSSLRGFLQSLSSIYEGNMYISNLFSFFEIQPSIQSGTIKEEIEKKELDCIEFHNVSFMYPGTERYVLKNISFKITKGQSMALVGLNGSGKTTLVKLLCRFYDPTEGNIYFDGVDIRNYDLDTLRKKISTIFQDYVRYEMTAKENIAIADRDTIDDIEFIKECAQKSEAGEFIEKLPNGYNEFLGRILNNGTELSIGQWQKIALARAFVRDGDLLILDEPTASLDPETEYKIFKKFKELTKGKMSLVITHRFSTVRMANTIIVLKDGALIEQGNHEELLNLNGEYARLYNLQAEAYQSNIKIGEQQGA